MDAHELNKKLQKARQLMQARNYAEALKLYGQLVRQFPQGGGEYGSAAAISGDYELADRIWGKFRAEQPANAEFLLRLAAEYQNIGRHSKARTLYADAVAAEPRNLELHLKLASLLARTNSVEDARVAVNRCLELAPQNERARYLSAQLDRRENKLAEAEKQFRDLIAAGLRDAETGYSCHSDLANILDRTDRFEEAITVLEQGKKLAQRHFQLEAERQAFYAQHESEVKKIKSLPKNLLETWGKAFPLTARAATPPVAFLSGSARSGTTLLERILDAHPAVAAVDESPAFKTVQSQMDFAASIIPSQRLNLFRQRYVKNLTGELGALPAGKTLLDKNPSRTVWLPALLRTFPEVRVLLALRDPRDILVSLYFQDHRRTNYLTFQQLAEHYASVMEVWLAVREWNGLNWLETRYEDVVADLQKEGSRVTQFLGLEWHPNQSHFFEKNREKPVMSTNYTDVTKPVYQRSVGRWQAYEKFLAPVLPGLQPYCRKFGYAI